MLQFPLLVRRLNMCGGLCLSPFIFSLPLNMCSGSCCWQIQYMFPFCGTSMESQEGHGPYVWKWLWQRQRKPQMHQDPKIPRHQLSEDNHEGQNQREVRPVIPPTWVLDTPTSMFLTCWLLRPYIMLLTDINLYDVVCMYNQTVAADVNISNLFSIGSLKLSGIAR